MGRLILMTCDNQTSGFIQEAELQYPAGMQAERITPQKLRKRQRAPPGTHVTPEVDESEFEGLGEAEKKQAIRQKRNRQSAQLSRERKKEYVSSLEEKINAHADTNEDLTESVKRLLQENEELRSRIAAQLGTTAATLEAS